MANGHGGRREGAGRKKKKATIIREKAIAEAGADAEYALGLFTVWQRDEAKDDSFRASCAREVLDRVWGRPTQHNTSDVNLKAQFDIVEWAKEREQRRQAITDTEDSDSADPNDEG